MFLGIGLNRIVNKFVDARKFMKTGCQQPSPGNALGPRSNLKTIKSNRIVAGRCINLIYAVDSTMTLFMLRS